MVIVSVEAVAAASREGGRASSDHIIPIVIALLESDGYEAVQLRVVARLARVSMTTIYKRFDTRDGLIVSALEWWMEANRYSDVASLVQADADLPVSERLARLFRTIFTPWEKHPRILDAYIRARKGPGGQRLIQRGFDVVVPVAREHLSAVSPDLAADLEQVLSAVAYGALAQFADGAVAVEEIVPILERAARLLTYGHDSAQPARVTAAIPKAPAVRGDIDPLGRVGR